MINDLMRKHKRLMLGILLVLIIFPFVLWGGSFGQGAGTGDTRGTAVVAMVGERPIPAEVYRQYLQAERQQRGGQFGQMPSMQQMMTDGSALKVLESLVGRELLSEQAEKGDYLFDQDYLVEKLKESREFQDEQGNFDPKLWNDAVKRVKNWNQLYENERQQLAYGMVIARALSSARVLDADLRKQFEEENTAIELKYIAVAPKVEPTEEQIKETYDQNPSAYDLPEKRRIEFAALSLVPAKPALADELVTRARAGEDFAELAKANSTSPTKDTGGELDWMADGPIVRPHQKPLFALAKGEVSEPIDGPGGYYIYKLDDERTNPDSNLREVKGRELLVAAKLDEAAYKAIQDKATAIYTKAKETGDLKAAATEAGVETQTSGLFTIESLNVENVPDADVRFLRSRFAAIALNDIVEPVEAQRNTYIAKVIGLEAAVPQPLDVVRAKVVEDTIARLSNSPEYMQKTADLAKSIADSAKSLQDIVTQHPELNATIESMAPFTTKTYEFGKGPMWNPRDVIAVAMEKDAGSFFGPITDFMGKPHFVELVSKTPPDEKKWTDEWPAQEKTLREQAVAQQQNRRMEDYMAFLREESLYQIDQDAFIRTLGLAPDQQEPAEPAEVPATGAEGAPAPAAEGTPAPDAATEAAAPVDAVPAEPAATEAVSSAPAPVEGVTAPAPEAPTPAETPAEVPPAAAPAAPAAP